MHMAQEDNILETGSDYSKDKEDTGKELADVAGNNLEEKNPALQERDSVEDMLDSMETTGCDCTEGTAASKNNLEMEQLEWCYLNLLEMEQPKWCYLNLLEMEQPE